MTKTVKAEKLNTGEMAQPSIDQSNVAGEQMRLLSSSKKVAAKNKTRSRTAILVPFTRNGSRPIAPLTAKELGVDETKTSIVNYDDIPIKSLQGGRTGAPEGEKIENRTKKTKITEKQKRLIDDFVAAKSKMSKNEKMDVHALHANLSEFALNNGGMDRVADAVLFLKEFDPLPKRAPEVWNSKNNETPVEFISRAYWPHVEIGSLSIAYLRRLDEKLATTYSSHIRDGRHAADDLLLATKTVKTKYRDRSISSSEVSLSGVSSSKKIAELSEDEKEKRRIYKAAKAREYYRQKVG